jgi:hypothetical protein
MIDPWIIFWFLLLLLLDLSLVELNNTTALVLERNGSDVCHQ